MCTRTAKSYCVCLLNIIRRRLRYGLQETTATAEFQSSFVVYGDWKTAAVDRRKRLFYFRSYDGFRTVLGVKNVARKTEKPKCRSRAGDESFYSPKRWKKRRRETKVCRVVRTAIL
ncbi:hypothetical protein QTP88_013151 [Uroleucon formosanum]